MLKRHNMSIETISRLRGTTSFRPLLNFLFHKNFRGHSIIRVGGIKPCKFLQRFPLYNSALFVLGIS